MLTTYKQPTMRDDQQLIQLRPALSLSTEQSGAIEQFQNQTLRPILKLQHDLLVQMFLSQVQKHKKAFLNLPKPARLEWVAQSIRSNTQL